MQLRDMDPWELEGSGYRCTITIARINDKQPWWFSSCTKCHRASTPSGNKYKCSGGCPCTTAEPKYRLSLIGTDGTATAEFTLFGRVARQIVGKPVISLIRSASKNHHRSSGDEFEHMLPELAALVSQKFTFSVSISTKNLTQRNVSFQVNGIVTFFGKQTHIPKPRDLTYDRGTTSSTPILSNNDDLTPTKKLRHDRKTIPCRRSLTLDGSDNTTPKSTTLGEEDGTEAVVPAELSILHPDNAESSSIIVEPTTATSVVTTAPEDSEAEKNPEIPRNAVKQRASAGRKKAAS